VRVEESPAHSFEKGRFPDAVGGMNDIDTLLEWPDVDWGEQRAPIL
jgi:hypothetical protein